MNTLRKFAAIAAASAALGLVTLGAGPATAQDRVVQGWQYYGNPTWQEQQQPYVNRDWDGYGDPRYRDGYAYGYGDPDFESGATTIAICPDGYRLDASGRLCWPD